MNLKTVFVILNIIVVVLIISSLANCENNITMDQESALQESLFKNYNRYRKPVKVFSNRVSVNLELIIFSIPKLDIKSQTLHTSSMLVVSWIDEYLVWNSSKFREIEYLRLPADTIWVPNVCNLQEITDRRCLTYGSVTDTKSEVIVHNSGLVYLSEMMNSVILCTFNVMNFPFDIQTCAFKFVITSTTLYTVDLAVNQSNIKTDFYIGNEEWDLLSTSVSEKDSMLNMLIILRRRPLFLTLTIIVPIVALSIMNCFCFLLPIKSGEKMGMSVALFLTFAVFGSILSDTMPQNSEHIPWFIVYVTTQIALSSLSVIMETLVVHLYHMNTCRSKMTDNKKDELQEETAAKGDNFDVSNKKSKLIDETWKSRAIKLDKVFMLLIVSTTITSICIFVLLIVS
ncbi:neuronal acetylcholine receptor subunit alpha-5-like [Crassostrea angulata]|uniref:neuronal acetylcholine receptor subunit alpha-5-like n=1 Tax=Magallana angulata TaxID=2784310 RepID=UPI0022B161D8|nr:neuronal acetylcholine receptor subunit alpha-5-like [Crassostrea angulata]